MTIPSDDEQAVTTALSTLSARVAILERWMRRSQRDRAAFIATLVILLAVLAWSLITR
jgi:type II secretory pathway component PulM